jgi:4-aminobutyrate aminotransferase-like enzyme
MIGIEFWDDAQSQLPASAVAKWVQSEMHDRNILLSLDGPNNNVIKIKPPMVFSLTDVALLSAELDLVSPTPLFYTPVMAVLNIPELLKHAFPTL